MKLKGPEKGLQLRERERERAEKKAKEAEEEIATMERWQMWRRNAPRGNPRFRETDRSQLTAVLFQPVQIQKLLISKS